MINTNEGLRCEQSESSEGREAVKESFGVKHQVAGGSLGEDSRAQLQGFARAMDEAAASEYAGASAGYPRWLLIHVLHAHLVVYLCKAKDNARDKVAKFYHLDRQYAKSRAASAEERQERVSRMAKLVSEAMRAVMIPTPLTRLARRRR